MRARVADIVRLASRISGVPETELRGKSRRRRHTRPRLACYIVAREHGHSFPQIGARIGGRDHTTVMGGCDNGAALIERVPEFAALVDELRCAAATSGPFVARHVVPDAPPVRDLAEGEKPDSAHKFHEGIARASIAMAAALAEARVG